MLNDTSDPNGSGGGNAVAGAKWHGRGQHGPLGRARMKSANTGESTYEHPRRGLSIELRTGASRRHDKDKPSQLAGELQALQRAIVAKPITTPNHAPGGF